MHLDLIREDMTQPPVAVIRNLEPEPAEPFGFGTRIIQEPEVDKMSKQVVIDMSEKVKNGTGKDPEQLFWRILVLVCLGIDHIPTGF
jgi:hypothetical protein